MTGYGEPAALALIPSPASVGLSELIINLKDALILSMDRINIMHGSNPKNLLIFTMVPLSVLIHPRPNP